MSEAKRPPDYSAMFNPSLFDRTATFDIRTQHRQQVAGSMAQNYDAEISDAVDRIIGKGWTLEALAGRLTSSPPNVEADEWETIYLDDHPILAFGPMRYETVEKSGSYIMTVSRDVKRFSPVPITESPE